MHTVLDLYGKTNPFVDLTAIPYQVFKVRKATNLYVACLICDTLMTKHRIVSSSSSTRVLLVLLEIVVLA